MTPQVWLAVAFGLAASVDDLRRGRIANWIPAVALLSGVVCQSALHGWRGAISSILGALGGFCALLVFHALGGMGGGDVKLMAGLGAVAGVEHVAVAALWTGFCGAVLAVGFLAVRALAGWVAKRPAPRVRAAGRGASIPYAPAIALGVCLSMIPGL